MAIQKELDRELTCKQCGEAHTNFIEERYNHNPRLTPIIVCPECGVGFDKWKY